jgi:hypothetical protein
MFNVPVRLDGIERRKRSTGLLHVVAGFFLIVSTGMYFGQKRNTELAPVLAVYGVAIVSLAYGFGRKKWDPAARYNHWVRLLQFLTFALLFITLLDEASPVRIASLGLWAVVILFLMFTERKIFHDTDLQVKTEGVMVPGYLRNHLLPWPEIESFILRNDYLTITRKNQKYVQLELMADMRPEDIRQINAFCHTQLQTN